MRRKMIGIFVFMLLISSVLSVSGTFEKKAIVKSVIKDKMSLISNNDAIGIFEEYKSSVDIPSPDNNSYTCIMFCNNHKQILDWISLVEELGFQKAWQKKFMSLTIFFIIPGTKFLFGLGDFRNWYSSLFVKLIYKDKFLDFLNNYDKLNGSGMITYLWFKGKTNRIVDFKAQPDNTWIDDSWILDGSKYIPNPEIWAELFFWYFDFPPQS